MKVFVLQKIEVKRHYLAWNLRFLSSFVGDDGPYLQWWPSGKADRHSCVDLLAHFSCWFTVKTFFKLHYWWGPWPLGTSSLSLALLFLLLSCLCILLVETSQHLSTNLAYSLQRFELHCLVIFYCKRLTANLCEWTFK